MRLKRVAAAYFSPTGNTKRAAITIAEQVADREGLPVQEMDLTLPEGRKDVRSFGPCELLVLGMPVYAGRIPNKILPVVQTLFKGNGALAVPVVTFGNRSYDNALIEMCSELEKNSFHTIAGAAFASEHVFSPLLAPGRPDEEDRKEILAFAGNVSSKIREIEPGENDGMAAVPEPVQVRGEFPIPGYYQPLGEDGQPAVFLKAKPKTADSCNDCGICAEVCPMGSVSSGNHGEVTGICIKCQACTRACPMHSRYFDDPAMLSHIRYLTDHYQRKAVNEVFL